MSIMSNDPVVRLVPALNWNARNELARCAFMRGNRCLLIVFLSSLSLFFFVTLSFLFGTCDKKDSASSIVCFRHSKNSFF